MEFWRLRMSFISIQTRLSTCIAETIRETLCYRGCSESEV